MRFGAAVNPDFRFSINGEISSAAELWCDGYELRAAEALYTYGSDAREFAGLAAVTSTRKDKGKVICLGTFPEEKVFTGIVGNHSGVKREMKHADNLLLVPREGGGRSGYFAVEFRGRDGNLELDGEYYDWMRKKAFKGKIEIKPFEVYCYENLSTESTFLKEISPDGDHPVF